MQEPAPGSIGSHRGMPSFEHTPDELMSSVSLHHCEGVAAQKPSEPFYISY
jgi:hypothetical protein